MAKIFVGHDISELEKHVKPYINPPDFPFSKIIHQSWFNTKEDIPQDWKRSKEKWIEYHPGWLYILWNKKMSRDFISKYEPDFLDTYDSLKYEIQRIDSMRYVILKWFGGLYSDLDIVPKRNIETYFTTNSDVYFLRSKNSPCYYTNSFMASKANTSGKFWDLLLEKIKHKTNNIYFGKWMTTMNVSGPIALTETVSEYDGLICQLPGIFNTQSIDKLEQNDKFIFETLRGGSWHAFDSKIINFVFTNRWFLFVILTLIVIIFIMGYFWYKKQYKECSMSLRKCLKTPVHLR